MGGSAMGGSLYGSDGSSSEEERSKLGNGGIRTWLCRRCGGLSRGVWKGLVLPGGAAL